MGLGLEILVVLLLILLNGLFSMSELALVSARRARLAVLERKGVAGAALARSLAEDPQRFLPTVQVGITLVAGKKRVPRPAAGKTALRTLSFISFCSSRVLRLPRSLGCRKI